MSCNHCHNQNKLMQREKGKMTAPLLLVLLLTIAYHAEANCPDDTNG